MGIQIVIDDKVKFKVKGVETDGAGISKPFDFDLIARRLTVDEFRAAQKDGAGTWEGDFLIDIVEAWDNVRGEGGTPVPYDKDMFRRLLQRPGIAALAMRAYTNTVQAREKN